MTKSRKGWRINSSSLRALVLAHRTKDGSVSRFRIRESNNEVLITSTYVQSSGAHRAWKYLYYLIMDGVKTGGYDTLDSFISWVIPKLANNPLPTAIGSNLVPVDDACPRCGERDADKLELPDEEDVHPTKITAYKRCLTCGYQKP